MIHHDYIPKKQDAYVEWHADFTEELAYHFAAFDVSANDFALLNSNNRVLSGLLKASDAANADAEAAVMELHLMIYRSQAFVRILVRRIKAHRGYAQAIGQRLGIEVQEVVADLSRHQSDGIHTFGDTARCA